MTKPARNPSEFSDFLIVTPQADLLDCMDKLGEILAQTYAVTVAMISATDNKNPSPLSPELAHNVLWSIQANLEQAMNTRKRLAELSRMASTGASS
jgi:hypothetical protein